MEDEGARGKVSGTGGELRPAPSPDCSFHHACIRASGRHQPLHRRGGTAGRKRVLPGAPPFQPPTATTRLLPQPFVPPPPTAFACPLNHACNSCPCLAPCTAPAEGRQVVINRYAGEAVLRGANVYCPGLLAASAGLAEGDLVGVSVAVELPGRWVEATGCQGQVGRVDSWTRTCTDVEYLISTSVICHPLVRV